MIASVHGNVQRVGSDSLVLQIGGIGLEIAAPSGLCAHLHVGEPLSLHTYLVVREDALNLYGFETREERDFFLLLLGVNGVGPRLALAIISLVAPDAIRRSVFNEQPEIFSKVPGVGRKTAQKILLHLQDKIKPGLEDLEPMAVMSERDGDVLDALTALGYSVVEAQAAIQNIPREAPEDTETRLRLALQYFSR
jgi:Holliday junction DNA helicase RuvA